MPETANTHLHRTNLHRTARTISTRGLHTGDQFVDPATLGVDICAAAYIASEGICPPEFLTDEAASIELIQASSLAMQVIQAISNGLETTPSVTEICPGHEVPDYIEHVSNWAAHRTAFRAKPPTASEVIGRILRTADALDTPHTLAA